MLFILFLSNWPPLNLTKEEQLVGREVLQGDVSMVQYDTNDGDM